MINTVQYGPKIQSHLITLLFAFDFDNIITRFHPPNKIYAAFSLALAVATKSGIESIVNDSGSNYHRISTSLYSTYCASGINCPQVSTTDPASAGRVPVW